MYRMILLGAVVSATLISASSRVLTAPASASAPDQATTAAPGTGKEIQHPAELVALAKEFRQWRGQRPEGVPDYAAEVQRQKKGLREFRDRLEALPTGGWPVHSRVDYLVLRGEMDDLDFDLTVIRQASRNPDYYTTQAVDRVRRLIGGHRQRGGGIIAPYDAKRGQAIIAALGQTAAIVEQASKNLTEAVPEMADMALDRLEDVRKHYQEFAEVVAPHLREAERGRIGAAADTAGAALEKSRGWIAASRSKMTAPYAIGRKAYEWYVQRVLMMPYTADDLLMHAEMERVRNWAFLQFERQKNRALPPLRPAATNAEYAEWIDATDVTVRNWIEQYDLVTRPPELGPMRTDTTGVHYIKPFEFLAFPSATRPGHSQIRFLLPDHWFSNQYYWEKNERMEPAVNHPHSEYPGHLFEGYVSQRATCELRRGHNSRGDSWTNYIEEVQLQLNYPFLRGARGRELLYGFAIGRAERVYASVKFAEGGLTPAQLEAHMMKTVPLMDPFVAKEHEVWRKFVDPAQVLTYQIGKFEVYKLLAARTQQLGDRFNLREFHDQLLATGQIPVSLARWEMTGLDDGVQSLWKPAPIPMASTP